MEKRRPFTLPYSTQLGCCSPDRQAWQFGRMHGARRRLSEPRIAGKAPTVWFSSQRLTSVGDSFLLMYTCGLSHTYCQVENSCQKNATNPGFYVLTSVSRQKLVNSLHVRRCGAPADLLQPDETGEPHVSQEHRHLCSCTRFRYNDREFRSSWRQGDAKSRRIDLRARSRDTGTRRPR